ncbi:hypothetical protein DPEC_G00061940 [Dallia pectoralis]|uniref:Uncharacterized protein n=1 Tax=Dallia pectoralis TaxID=75939 RepID=A0ACC2H7E7_DALPE|nr:hypothetical protein DPEC_G00061940 [Dallia pectoralis]
MVIEPTEKKQRPAKQVEDLALSQNKGRPVSEGIPGGSTSSEPATSQDPDSDGVLFLMDYHATAVLLEADETDGEETLSAVTERDPERPAEVLSPLCY